MCARTTFSPPPKPANNDMDVVGLASPCLCPCPPAVCRGPGSKGCQIEVAPAVSDKRTQVSDNEAYTGNAVSLPEDDASRASMPLADGCLDYFPNALAYVAFISKKGSDKHNPGQEMHWARDKSTDHANKMMRHLIDRGRMDQDGIRHSGNLAWRALANLQNELEEAGLCPRSRASK